MVVEKMEKNMNMNGCHNKILIIGVTRIKKNGWKDNSKNSEIEKLKKEKNNNRKMVSKM